MVFAALALAKGRVLNFFDESSSMLDPHTKWEGKTRERPTERQEESVPYKGSSLSRICINNTNKHSSLLGCSSAHAICWKTHIAALTMVLCLKVYKNKSSQMNLSSVASAYLIVVKLPAGRNEMCHQWEHCQSTKRSTVEAWSLIVTNSSYWKGRK